MRVIRRFIRDRILIMDGGHSSECWAWKRCTRDGYGRAEIGGITYQAHRVSYEAFVGPIPDGLELDHLCYVANCVNPAHLEPVTREENLRRKHIKRGYVIGGKVVRGGRRFREPRPPRQPATHCKHGHELTPENTRILTTARTGAKYRACHLCLQRRRREYWVRRREREGVTPAHRNRLTVEQVVAIRKDQRPAKVVAPDMGVTFHAIYAVRRGSTHKHVGETRAEQQSLLSRGGEAEHLAAPPATRTTRQHDGGGTTP